MYGRYPPRSDRTPRRRDSATLEPLFDRCGPRDMVAVLAKTGPRAGRRVRCRTPPPPTGGWRHATRPGGPAARRYSRAGTPAGRTPPKQRRPRCRTGRKLLKAGRMALEGGRHLAARRPRRGGSPSTAASGPIPGRACDVCLVSSARACCQRQHVKRIDWLFPGGGEILRLSGCPPRRDPAPSVAGARWQTRRPPPASPRTSAARVVAGARGRRAVRPRSSSRAGLTQNPLSKRFLQGRRRRNADRCASLPSAARGLSRLAMSQVGHRRGQWPPRNRLPLGRSAVADAPSAPGPHQAGRSRLDAEPAEQAVPPGTAPPERRQVRCSLPISAARGLSRLAMSQVGHRRGQWPPRNRLPLDMRHYFS